jgi:hypothetical protein
MEYNRRVLKKLKIQLPYDSAIHYLLGISKINEICMLKRHLCSHVYCSTIYNSQEMEKACP